MKTKNKIKEKLEKKNKRKIKEIKTKSIIYNSYMKKKPTPVLPTLYILHYLLLYHTFHHHPHQLIPYHFITI